MKRALLRLYRFFDARHGLLYGVLAILVAALAVCVLSFARFSEDIGAFLPQSEQNARMSEAYQHLNTTNTIMVSISPADTAADKDLLAEASEAFVERLRQNDTLHLTQTILNKISSEEITKITDFIVENLPLLMTDEDYQRIDTLLVDVQRMDNEVCWTANLMQSPTAGALQNMLFNDPLHISNNILKDFQSAHEKGNFAQHNGCIFSADSTSALITLTSDVPSSETQINKKWLGFIGETAHQVEADFQQKIRISHIGASDISIGNAEQIKQDTLLTSLLAVVLIAGLLYFYFRNVRAILLLLVSVLFGLLAAVAILAIFKDEISVIAVGVGSIIIGIAANYPLHFLSHLQEGHSREETLRDIAMPLVIGNITTVGAFLSLLFIQSDAMRDMGWFSALLLVCTIAFVLIFLPHLFKKSLFIGEKHDNPLFEKIASFALDEKKYVVLAVVILTIPLYIFSTRTEFETDLHKINYMTEDQQSELQKLLAATADTSDLDKTYIVCEADTREAALRKHDRLRTVVDSLKKTGFIEKCHGVSRFAPSAKYQNERIEKWNDFWAERHDLLNLQLTQSSVEFGFHKDFFSPFIGRTGQKLIIGPTADFTPMREALTNQYIYEADGKCLVYTIVRSDNDFTQEMREIVNNIAPGIYTFDDKSLFTSMVGTLSDNFNEVLFFCAFLVFAFLCASFGRIELSIIAFIPLTIGWIWILGLMDLFDIRFNIVNIILATFIFGQGDDYTIFVTEGLMHEYTHRKKTLAAYKKSVALSALIMFIGIGVLVFAKHPAMKSLAQVTIVGMSSVILMAYLFPPLLFKWLTMSKGKPRLMPITLRNLAVTVGCFTIFLICSIIYSVLGFALLTVGGKSEKHKLLFHKMICWIFRKFVQLLPGVKHTVQNLGGYDFEKPSILISNHQSHLDLMYILMLNPKIICLTNKWVWNCPFYGRIIRFAEYYPISNGVEASIDTLRSAVERGYSILIFPEGTRSADGTILRFHQGAFHLADVFGLDIVPILLHGLNDVFPKQEFLLRKGRVDIKILPPMTKRHELRADKEPRRVAQAVRHYYEAAYETLRTEVETPDYFRNLVYHNYIYKGADIAREAKRIIYADDTADWIASLPDEGEITVGHCGRGERTLLAALVKRHLHITATEADEEQLSVARNCASVPANLEYKEETK